MYGNPAPIESGDRLPLRERIVAAGTWTLVGYGLSSVIRFGSNLVLTRLLVPEMFGVMAIATIVMVGLAMFSDLGLKQNIVQSKRGNDPVYLNTAWVIQIIRGVLLWSISLLISLSILIANHFQVIPKDVVYANQSLPFVIAILSFTAIIAGFNSTKQFQASRNLAVGRVTLIEIVGQLVGLLCIFGWIAVDRSIWALVFGNLSSAAVVAILSHWWLPGVPNRWEWDKRAFLEIVDFGKWIFASSILGFIASQGDRLLLGGMVDTTLLGVYVIAFLIFNSVETLLMKIIGDISFPALSEVVRERAADLRVHYYRIHTVVASFAYFCSGALMISGQSLIALLYDSRYAQAGWMLELLAAALLTIPFRVVPACLLALGLARLNSHILTVRIVSLFVLTLLGFHFFGLRGAVWGVVGSYFAELLAIFFYKIKYKLLDWRKEMLLLPTWAAGALFALVLNVVLAR